MRLIIKKITFLSLFFFTVCASAQRFADQVPQIRRYYQKDIVDSVDGIMLYNRLIGAIGGDSINYNKAGYNMQGWNEDFYMSGKLLHRGYYVDGQIIVFKNFFENGQVERNAVNPDPLHVNIEVFYENGNTRKKLNYYDGKLQKKYEFFTNGNPKYSEENDKDLKYITLKKSWYSNGMPETDLEMVDEKSKKYSSKNYYSNGKVKEEGIFILDNNGKLNKDGTWNYFDQSGKQKKSEKYTAPKVAVN
ncbi:MAG: hypothetical protein JSU07_00365 [Bacteroidetes bacterium]|nr:hypothetical protein [Bacteroidota bacterium]